MKIASADVVVTSPGRNFVTLRVTTDDGLTGLGDATLNGRELAVRSYLADHVRDVPESEAEAEVESGAQAQGEVEVARGADGGAGSRAVLAAGRAGRGRRSPVEPARPRSGVDAEPVDGYKTFKARAVPRAPGARRRRPEQCGATVCG